jgi:DNA-binding MarR family transcriptional regulator
MRRNETMTETRTENGPAIPVGMAIGQVVGQAETVLTKLLAGVLAEAGATRETYLAMQRLLVRGDEAGRDAYVRDLGDWLDLDLWSAGELANALVAEGLFSLDRETIRLTPRGAELRERIRRGIGDLMAPVWEQLDPADVETTVRTLRQVTKLARDVRPAADGAR